MPETVLSNRISQRSVTSLTPSSLGTVTTRRFTLESILSVERDLCTSLLASSAGTRTGTTRNPGQPFYRNSSPRKPKSSGGSTCSPVPELPQGIDSVHPPTPPRVRPGGGLLPYRADSARGLKAGLGHSGQDSQLPEARTQAATHH